MQTVYILYDVDGWAYHHQARALERLAPAGVDIAMSPCRKGSVVHVELPDTAPDLVFMMNSHRAPQVRAMIAERDMATRLVTYWSVGWPHNAEALPRVLDASDWIVFNNLDCWERAGRPEKSSWISNGVDLDTFRVVAPLAERAPKVLWSGSEVHRTLKGYDDFIVPLGRIAERHGIGFEALLIESRGTDKRTLEEMADWYNTGTVYLCASATEGTPNTALEAAACGCAIVTSPVGNMPELIRSAENGLLVERDLDRLAEAMLTACDSHQALASVMLDDIKAWDWRHAAPRYFALFDDIIQERDLEAHRRT